MSSVSSPLGTFFPQAFSPPAADQNSRSQWLQPAEQQTPAPVDTVTLSGYFSSFTQLNSPAPPAQPATLSFLASSNTSTANQAPASAAAPQQIAAAAAAPQQQVAVAATSNGAASVAAQNSFVSPAANLQTPATNPAAATGAGALPPAVQGASSPINASPAAQQQELAQLDQVLQQLGIDPSSIPLSEQLSMVLYLDDPSALAQLVQSLGQVVQTAHLKPLGGAAPAQPQNPDQLKSAPTQTAPATVAAAAAPNQNPAAAPPQQVAAAATSNGAATVAAPAGNAAAAANAPNPAALTANGFAAQFQELQVSLQALGANSFAATAATAAPGGALNVVA
jgi:hypothetical protein